MRQELSQLVKAVVNRRMAAVMVAAARWVEVVAVLRVMGEEKLAMEAMVVMVAVVVVVVVVVVRVRSFELLMTHALHGCKGE